ncbi:MAG: hypothetical protein GY723_00325 [bacterium]|nr:hypothetical protein [bacterium]
MVETTEPLCAWTEPCDGGLRFEVTHRGDWVPGRLFLPSGSGPFPLVLVQHGAGSSKDDPVMDTVTAPWIRGGAAVARIDFPLHGERSDPKLSARVLGALAADDERTPVEEGLWGDLMRQATGDLSRSLDALVRLPEIDASHIAYAGFSLGAILGTPFCARDERIRAAALALGGGGMAPAPNDPLQYIAQIAPRPVLFVNALRDERIPRDRAEALHAAAGAPKQIEWFDCAHSELPGTALKRMWSFLRTALGI